MVRCVVPFCSKNGKASDISFHEFPSNLDYMNAWLKVISRKDFVPNSKSNSSRVCSLHFTKDDFIVCGKRRRLKKDAVPSIFPGYPSYKIPVPQKKRREIVRKEYIPKRQKIEKHGEPCTFVECIPEKSEELGMLVECISVENKEPCMLMECVSEKHEEPYMIRPMESILDVKQVDEEHVEHSFSVSKEVQTVGNYREELDAVKRKKKSMRAKIWRMNDKLTGLQKELEKYKEKELRHDGNVYHKALDDILNDVSVDPMHELGQFLLDQIKNYGKKKPTWDSSTIEVCALWRHYSPRGYHFAKAENMLRLPSETTLKLHKKVAKYQIELVSEPEKEIDQNEKH